MSQRLLMGGGTRLLQGGGTRLLQGQAAPVAEPEPEVVIFGAGGGSGGGGMVQQRLLRRRASAKAPAAAARLEIRSHPATCVVADGEALEQARAMIEDELWLFGGEPF